MPIAELLRTIEDGARAEEAAVRAAAVADVARIDADAARARDLCRATARDDATRASTSTADAALAEATSRARVEVLTARADMLARVRAAAAELLHDALAAAAAELGPALVAAALAHTGGGAGVLRVAPALAAHTRAATLAPLRVEIDPQVAGVVVELDSGTRIEATLDAILDRDWPSLAPGVLADAREVAP